MTSADKIACSVGVLTFNSGGSLEQTLGAVRDFAEVIVCDGGSTDNTLDIARKYGCKITFQDPKFKRDDGKIKDFGGVRNQTLDSASYKWFFYVDSDELLSSELIEEIRSTVLNCKQPSAFWIPRKYVVNGLIIDCATTYPSKQMRLFHRDGVNRFIKTIHEKIEVKKETPISQLNNIMLIPMTTDVVAIQKKWNYYLDLEEERVGDMTFLFWLKSCAENFKISTLYLFRLLRNTFFCRGNKMPFTLEMQRHIYHINMCKRFFKMIK
jgi:glycosyltransferase involved in cell wall biosynthesis